VAGGRVWRGAVGLLAIGGDYWTADGRSDREVCCYTETENISTSSSVRLTSAACECFQDGQ
jgi:hypothetical protein